MSSPITDIRAIVREHEDKHYDDGHGYKPDCNCMERIGYIMQVFYPEGIENAMTDDEDFYDSGNVGGLLDDE